MVSLYLVQLGVLFLDFKEFCLHNYVFICFVCGSRKIENFFFFTFFSASGVAENSDGAYLGCFYDRLLEDRRPISNPKPTAWNNLDRTGRFGIKIGFHHTFLLKWNQLPLFSSVSLLKSFFKLALLSHFLSGLFLPFLLAIIPPPLFFRSDLAVSSSFSLHRQNLNWP